MIRSSLSGQDHGAGSVGRALQLQTQTQMASSSNSDTQENSLRDLRDPLHFARSLYQSYASAPDSMKTGTVLRANSSAHFIDGEDLESFLDGGQRDLESASYNGGTPSKSFKVNRGGSSVEKDKEKEKERRGKWDLPDGRLYYQYPLYCEGMPKPACRGYLHMACLLLLPFLQWKLWQESNGNAVGRAASILYMLGNFVCYGASAFYHVPRWSPQAEILLQKIDHAGIAITSVGTFIPCIMLLFPSQEGICFLCILLALFAYNIYGIVTLRPSVLSHILIPCTSVLFLHRIWETFTPLELTLYFATVVVKACGTFTFLTHIPDPVPETFGYHEVFHCFVVAGSCCIYLCNLSIIRRTCNPYALDVDIGEHLDLGLGILSFK
jgi:hemolysin III